MKLPSEPIQLPLQTMQPAGKTESATVRQPAHAQPLPAGALAPLASLEDLAVVDRQPVSFYALYKLTLEFMHQQFPKVPEDQLTRVADDLVGFRTIRSEADLQKVGQCIDTMRAIAGQLSDADVMSLAAVFVEKGVIDKKEIDRLAGSASLRDAARAFFAGALVTTSSFGVARVAATGALACGAPGWSFPVVLCGLAATLNAAFATHSAKAGLGASYAPDGPQAPDPRLPATQQFAVAQRGQWPFLSFSVLFMATEAALRAAGVSGRTDPWTAQGAMTAASTTAGGCTGLGLWCCGPAHAAAPSTRDPVLPSFLVPRLQDGRVDSDSLRRTLDGLQTHWTHATCGWLAQALCCTAQARAAASEQATDGKAAWVRNTIGNGVALLPATILSLGSSMASAVNPGLSTVLGGLGSLALIWPGWMNRQVYANTVGDTVVEGVRHVASRVHGALQPARSQAQAGAQV